jgi:hypothetical protein
MAQIVYMIMDAIVDQLTAALITNVSESDPIRANIVKMGLLVENKTRQNIQIGVQGGDHELPDQQDGIVTLEKLPNLSMVFPAREIGGGQTWMRRGVVRIEAFFLHKGINEVIAHDYGYDLLGRVMSNIESTPLENLNSDDYGELAVGNPYVYANTFFETGGPPTSYIFRGKVSWVVFTERP